MCAFGLHLAFPLTGWWFVAPFALAGLFAAWCSLAPRAAAYVGYASGLVFFALSFSWFGETAGALLGPAAPILDLGPAAIESVAFGVAALTASVAVRRCAPGWVPFVVAAGYTLCELLRSSGVMGAPLDQISVAFIDTPLRPLAAFTGGYGITFAVAAMAATLGWWCLDLRDRSRARATGITWAGVALAAAFAWSAWPARHAAPPATRVAVVQGGIEQTLKMSAAGLDLAIDRYTTMTESLRGDRPQLILWPETVINTVLNDPAPETRALGERFAALARSLGATLYVGSLADVPEGTINAIYVYDPAAAPAADAAGASAIYGKEQLVPFAEYVPGPAWLRALPETDKISAYAPAHNAVTTFAGATPLICWESLFGDIAFARLHDAPTVYLIATDDAWFGHSAFPYEHAMAASLRAVETGRWVVQAGATGISGIVAPDGSWTTRTELGTAATVTGDVGAPAPGPYAFLGPAPVALALLFLTLGPMLRGRAA